MKDKSYHVPNCAATPMVTGCHPELVVTEFLDALTATYYQKFIGFLRGTVAIDQIDSTA
jgi:hypothetical protein